MSSKLFFIFELEQFITWILSVTTKQNETSEVNVLILNSSALSNGLNRIGAPSLYLRMKIDLVLEMHIFGTPDDGKSPKTQ